jgi:hypothetical protein
MLSDENSMLFQSPGHFGFFFYHAYWHHTSVTGNIRQEFPPIFSLKAPWGSPHKCGKPYSNYYPPSTHTHIESYHEDSLLLKVIKALHHLVNIYFVLIMEQQKNDIHMDLALRQLCVCRVQKLTPCENLNKNNSSLYLHNPLISLVLLHDKIFSKYHLR